MAKLANFKKAISGKPATSSAESGGGNDDLSDWKSVRLKFTPEPGKVSDCEFINLLKSLSPTSYNTLTPQWTEKLRNIPTKKCIIFL